MNGERWSIERWESIQDLNLALGKARLTPRQLRLVQMRFVENATLDDVAQEFGLHSREGIRAMEARILRQLRSPMLIKYLERPWSPVDKDARQRGRDWSLAGSMLARYRWLVEEATGSPEAALIREQIKTWLRDLDAVASPSGHQRELASVLREGIRVRLRARQIKFETRQEADGRWFAEVVGLPDTIAYGASEMEVVYLARAKAVDILRTRGEIPVM